MLLAGYLEHTLLAMQIAVNLDKVSNPHLTSFTALFRDNHARTF
ncbi:hypothetical protein MGWOODY_XGa536 [hydrothermal vent metagenome]|uniref:Uncharacterized protein n=1 Tax=hydrothermal vent metagenome TaxID=652676 RepID=A0A160TPF2_9ZZZZ